MFITRTPVMLDADDGGGGGAPPAEPTSLADARAQLAAGAPLEIIEVPDELAGPGGTPDVQPTNPTVGGTPAAAPLQGAPVVEAPAPVDPFAQYGYTNAQGQFISGEAVVRDAMAFAQGAQTDAGLRLIIAQGLQRIGKSPEIIRAFMEDRLTLAEAQGAPPAPAPFADIPDEDAITGAEAKRIVQESLARQQAEFQQTLSQTLQQELQRNLAPLQGAVQEDRQRIARQTVDATLVELLSTDGTPASVDQTAVQDVLAHAARYIQPNNWDPTHIRQAVIQGAADSRAEVAQLQAAYLARKAADDAKSPTTTAGQTTGGEAAPEPKNLAEARAVMRASNLWNS